MTGKEQKSAVLKPAKTQTPMPSTPLMPLSSAVAAKPAIQEALKRLCSLKRQAQFTPFDIESWCAALSVFPPSLVNFVIVEFCISSDPFPDCGKILMRCQAEMQKRSTVISQADITKPMPSTIKAVAKAFEIDLKD